MARVELYGSNNITFNADGIVAQRRFLCLWPERFAVKPAIGEPYPAYSGLYCNNVRIEGTGQSTASGGHTHAFIFADYSTADKAEQQGSGSQIEESLNFGGEMLTRAGGKWKDCQKNVQEDDIGGQFFPRLEYTVERTVPSITEWTKILLKATGRCNSSTFLGGLEGKWLLQGASARSFVDDTGVKKWAITMSFVYNEIGWQKAWHKECTKDGDDKPVARWEEVLYKKEGSDQFTEKMYQTYDFNQIVSNRRT